MVLKNVVKVIDKDYDARGIFSANIDIKEDSRQGALGTDMAKGFARTYDTGYEMKI